MQSEELNQRLTQLTNAADSQTQTFKSSLDKLHQNIVDTYLWWPEASKDGAYLKSLHKDAGIRTRARGGNQPNFYPLVHLEWNTDITQKASTVSGWAQFLLALHETATEDTAKYSNMRSDLINHHHTRRVTKPSWRYHWPL